MAEKIVTRLIITHADMDPKFMVDAIGAVGDRVWEAKSLRPKTTLREKYSGWMMANIYPITTSVDDAVCDMYNKRIEPLASSIKVLNCEFSKRFSIVTYSIGAPPLWLKAGTVSKLAALGVDIDFDIYYLPEKAK